LKSFSGGGLRSPSLVRDALFTNFEEKSALGMYLWSLFNERTKCGAEDKIVHRICEHHKEFGKKLPKTAGFCHITSTLSYPSCDNVDLMYRLSNAHTQIRGDDSGLGSLSSSYYWSSLPKSVSKVLTKVAEIMDICHYSKVRIISVDNGYLSDYEKLVLVANKISVVDGSLSPPCSENSVVGIYGSTKLPTIKFLSRKGSMPKITKTAVEYTFDPTHMSTLLPDGIFFLKVFIHPSLQSLVDIGLFLYPTYNPAKPEIFLTNLKIRESLTLAEISQRVVKATYYRTMYPYNKLPFHAVDPYRSRAGTSDLIRLCRRGGKKEEKKKDILIKDILEEEEKKETARVELVFEDFVDLEGEEELKKVSVLDENEIIKKFQTEIASLMGSKAAHIKNTNSYKLIRGIVTRNFDSVPIEYRSIGRLTFEALVGKVPEQVEFLSMLKQHIEQPERSKRPKINEERKSHLVVPTNAVAITNNEAVPEEDFSDLAYVRKGTKHKDRSANNDV